MDLPEWKELPFRDGTRQVPEHLASMMSGLDTITLTYEQAVIAANNRIVGDALGKAQGDLIREHFSSLLGHH